MSDFDSVFVQREEAIQAVHLCLPMIESALASRAAGDSGFLYIVVLKLGHGPDRSSFDNCVLYEHAVGDRERWDADYAAFARAKARVSWHTGLDSHIVQETKPHLLAAHDTLLWGSVVLDGIVVAASGADPWYDEAFSGAIAMCLRAIAKKRVAAARRAGLFLGDGSVRAL